MNKIFLRSILLIIAAGLLFLILFSSRSPFGKNNSSFATESGKEITRIELGENGKRLILEKKGEDWLINGKTEARKSCVLFIVRILKEIKIKSPVSPELFKNEIVLKDIIPVKVKVYEKRRLLKSFLVYKTRSNAYGNFMKIRESSKPFIVYVPGYDGDIGSEFTMNELFWQPYTIFNLLPSEIASVNLENLSDTASSFSIVNRNHHCYLSADRFDLRGWDSTLVARYLSYFVRIPFESWAFDMVEAEKKRIEAQLPVYRITVTTVSGRKTRLTLWAMITDENSAKRVDSDRLLGKTDESNELFIMRYFDIDPIIKKRSYFFPQ
jgi:hypothetical protein